jgi:hypothetical protein
MFLYEKLAVPKPTEDDSLESASAGTPFFVLVTRFRMSPDDWLPVTNPSRTELYDWGPLQNFQTD